MRKLDLFCLTWFFQSPDCLQLFDDWGEGVGDHGDHDEQGEQQDQHRGHDQLDVSARHPSLLLKTVFTNPRQHGPRVLWTRKIHLFKEIFIIFKSDLSLEIWLSVLVFLVIVIVAVLVRTGHLSQGNWPVHFKNWQFAQTLEKWYFLMEALWGLRQTTNTSRC